MTYDAENLADSLSIEEAISLADVATAKI